MYSWPNKDSWEACDSEQRLYWALRVLQQEVRSHYRTSKKKMPDNIAEALALAELAADEA